MAECKEGCGRVARSRGWCSSHYGAGERASSTTRFGIISDTTQAQTGR